MDYRLEQLRFELREDPSSRIFFKLGEHLRREGELDEAVEILRRGLEEHPTYVSAWVSLGRALIDRGIESTEASTALGRALALDPENAVASRYAGEAAIANGEWVEAIKALKRARALSPHDEALDERIRWSRGIWRKWASSRRRTRRQTPSSASRWVTSASVTMTGRVAGPESLQALKRGRDPLQRHRGSKLRRRR